MLCSAGPCWTPCPALSFIPPATVLRLTSCRVLAGKGTVVSLMGPASKLVCRVDCKPPLTTTAGPLLQALAGKDGFLQKERLENYDALRNKPMEDATSNLSGWLHFGHISQQRVGLEAGKLKSAAKVSASTDPGLLAADWLCLGLQPEDCGHGGWQAQERLQGQYLYWREPDLLCYDSPPVLACSLPIEFVYTASQQ